MQLITSTSSFDEVVNLLDGALRQKRARIELFRIKWFSPASGR
jgi:hypothetical protein